MIWSAWPSPKDLGPSCMSPNWLIIPSQRYSVPWRLVIRLGGANRLTAPAGWIYAVEAGVYLLIKLACTYSLFVQALALKSQTAIEGEYCAGCSRIPLVKKNGYGGTMFWGESQFSSQTSG